MMARHQPRHVLFVCDNSCINCKGSICRCLDEPTRRQATPKEVSWFKLSPGGGGVQTPSGARRQQGGHRRRGSIGRSAAGERAPAVPQSLQCAPLHPRPFSAQTHPRVARRPCHVQMWAVSISGPCLRARSAPQGGGMDCSQSKFG